jgi:hypothetical protein
LQKFAVNFPDEFRTAKHLELDARFEIARKIARMTFAGLGPLHGVWIVSLKDWGAQVQEKLLGRLGALELHFKRGGRARRV